jgi:outer membrane protein insertion porin family
VLPGGDVSLVANFEYRITIAGPVAIAPFMDIGMNPIIRKSQLRTSDAQFATLNSEPLGCPTRDAGTGECDPTNQTTHQFTRNIPLVSGTNWYPRMSTGIELQVFLPVVNAPFRIYYAYNPLRLDDRAQNPLVLSGSALDKLFTVPKGTGTACGPLTTATCLGSGAAIATEQAVVAQYGSQFRIREPRKTFRFTVATTF